ncbi:hypothetical protein QBC35DRAFT_69041 [Podospora australis]|uniref:AA1-like domain-containing protein n=1 Tax=Podospora australis TaxID=1536484 RepID=A0AAN7AEB1_9PEZI|nr:hypothetical protein QBC35DRAFT_69041 [Podospora australis]
MLQVLFALAALLPLATTLPAFALHYAVPLSLKAMVDDGDCTLPAAYTVRGIQEVIMNYNSAKPTVSLTFSYDDASTSLHTFCQYNSTSVNVGPPGLTARWACDNPTVQFIYELEDSKLTLIERACPEENLTRHFEASDSIPLKDNLRCSLQGANIVCSTDPTSYSKNFSSLQPSPY